MDSYGDAIYAISQNTTALVVGICSVKFDSGSEQMDSKEVELTIGWIGC